jgi:hypothetical protein
MGTTVAEVSSDLPVPSLTHKIPVSTAGVTVATTNSAASSQESWSVIAERPLSIAATSSAAQERPVSSSSDTPETARQIPKVALNFKTPHLHSVTESSSFFTGTSTSRFNSNLMEWAGQQGVADIFLRVRAVFHEGTGNTDNRVLAFSSVMRSIEDICSLEQPNGVRDDSKECATCRVAALVFIQTLREAARDADIDQDADKVTRLLALLSAIGSAQSKDSYAHRTFAKWLFIFLRASVLSLLFQREFEDTKEGRAEERVATHEFERLRRFPRLHLPKPLQIESDFSLSDIEFSSYSWLEIENLTNAATKLDLQNITKMRTTKMNVLSVEQQEYQFAWLSRCFSKLCTDTFQTTACCCLCAEVSSLSPVLEMDFFLNIARGCPSAIVRMNARVAASDLDGSKIPAMLTQTLGLFLQAAKEQIEDDSVEKENLAKIEALCSFEEECPSVEISEMIDSIIKALISFIASDCKREDRPSSAELLALDGQSASVQAIHALSILGIVYGWDAFTEDILPQLLEFLKPCHDSHVRFVFLRIIGKMSCRAISEYPNGEAASLHEMHKKFQIVMQNSQYSSSILEQQAAAISLLESSTPIVNKQHDYLGVNQMKVIHTKSYLEQLAVHIFVQ